MPEDCAYAILKAVIALMAVIDRCFEEDGFDLPGFDLGGLYHDDLLPLREQLEELVD